MAVRKRLLGALLALVAAASVLADDSHPLSQPAAVLQRRSDAGVRSLAYSPDGKLLAAGYADGSIALWDAATHEVAWSPEEMDEAVSAVAFSPDGRVFAAGSGAQKAGSRGEVCLWGTAMRNETARVTGWEGMVACVRFSPDGRTLAMSGGVYNKKGEVRLRDMATGRVAALPWAGKHSHYIMAVAFSPDSRFLAANCNRSLTIWDCIERREVFPTKQTLQAWVQSLAFSPDGKVLAAGLAGGKARRANPSDFALWDVPGFEESATQIATTTAGVLSVDFSPDSRFFAAGGYQGLVQLWEVATRNLIASFESGDPTVAAVAFSPDGRFIAAGTSAGKVKLWALPTAP